MYLTWLVVYLLIMVGVGYYFSKKVHNAEDYVLAGSTLGFFPICGSIMATASGSFAIIAASGRGFTEGLSFLTHNVGYMFFGVLAAVLLGSVIRVLKLHTIPELFEKRFGRWAALLPAVVIGLLFMTPLFAVQLVGMGSILESTFDIPFNFGVCIGFAVCVAFTMAGGMFSVAWTDAFQMIVIFFGAFLLFFLSAGELGGVVEAVKNIEPEIINPFQISFNEWLSLFLIFGPMSFVYQTTWQRMAAAKSKKIAVTAVSTGFAFVLVMTILTVFIGMFARQLLPLDTKPDLVYSTLLTKVIDPRISGLFVVTLFSAILTTATSFLLSGATSIARDIYTQWVNPSCTDKQLLVVLRGSTIAMAMVGLLIAFLVKDIWTIAIYAKAISVSVLFFPAMAAFFWKQATQTGIVASMIVGALVAIVWEALGNPLSVNSVIPGMLLNFVVLVVVSLVTDHSKGEEVAAFFFRYRNEPALDDG